MHASDQSKGHDHDLSLPPPQASIVVALDRMVIKQYRLLRLVDGGVPSFGVSAVARTTFVVSPMTRKISAGRDCRPSRWSVKGLW